MAGTAALVPRHDDPRAVFAGSGLEVLGSARPSSGEPNDGVQELANKLKRTGEEAVFATGFASFFPDVGTAARPIVQIL